MSLVVNLNDRNFKKTITKNPLVLVDFWASWCGPCKVTASKIENFATQYEGKLLFCKVQVDDEYCLTTYTEQGILSVPTLIIYKKGKEFLRLVGSKTDQEILLAIEKSLV